MKRTQQIAIWGSLGGMIVAALIAGCGGGATSAVGPPGGGGGHPSPSPSPAPSVTPVLTGNLNVAVSGTYPTQVEGAAANAEVDFTCGCTGVAGTGTADGTGNFNIVTDSTPVPTPNPSYTLVPGRNYVVIGTAALGTGGRAQAWTMVFAGNDTSRNQYLSGTNASDPITAAVALYVFANSSGSSIAFDDWNFATLQGFYTHLLTAPTAQETTLLDDIVLQQEAGKWMYPAKPRWRPLRIKNPTIAADLAAVKAGDPSNVPTPCPTPGGGGPAVCTSPFPTP
jgi:hypothetical protein